MLARLGSFLICALRLGYQCTVCVLLQSTSHIVVRFPPVPSLKLSESNDLGRSVCLESLSCFPDESLRRHVGLSGDPAVFIILLSGW